MSDATRDERILVLAPAGRNARMVEGVLARAGLDVFVCADTDHLCREIAAGGGAVVLAEEALTRTGLAALVDALERQPAWSETPVLVLTGTGQTTRESVFVVQALGPRGNVTLLERPVRILTLVSAAQTALRARRRQYEVRDLLAREQSARAQAEAASTAKDHFLATLSHELRTPLTPVLMAAGALADAPDLPPGVREDLDMIRRNVELEAKLIDDLLDLTRIARGKLELHYETADVHAVLRHGVKTCCDAADLREKQLTVEVELLARAHHVWGDPARLSQVFWNLLKNAVKFTPPGGTIHVRTTNRPADGALVCTVADTGIGIEPDAIGRIFAAFEQEDRHVTRQFGGLGLGLAITKALVDFHGGAIEAASDGKGRGATFTVTLPTTRAPEAAAPREPRAGAPRAVNGRPLSILLVEDHDSTSRVMAKLLRSLSYEVALAGDVATAKRLVDGNRFDVIVSDLGLPDGTGLDLVRHVRARDNGHATPAIAVSGFGMEEDVRRSKEAGFAEHLVKPIDLDKLTAAIRRVTGR